MIPSLGTRREVRPGRCVRCERFVARGAPLQLYDLHTRNVEYQEAWQWQKEYAAMLAESRHKLGVPEALAVLQHEPVYTLGTGSTLDNVKFDLDSPPHPLFRTERGGEVTFHGPGQLVAYPILDLKRHGQDLHQYLRDLEAVVINALGQVSGIEAFRVEGLTGVWTSSGKIAATGIRASRWVSYHGIALNVCPDLTPFEAIVPCGIPDRPVTSVVQHLRQTAGSGIGLSSAAEHKLLDEYSAAIVEAIESHFGFSVTEPIHELSLPEVDL